MDDVIWGGGLENLVGAEDEIRRPIVAMERGGYRNADFVGQMNALLNIYDGLNCRQIGSSVLGKPLYALILGKGPEPVHINAAVHANEWITAPLLLRFVEELASGRGAGNACGLDAVTLWAVPMANPDGADLAQDGIPPGCAWAEELAAWNGGSGDFRRWKANIRGVDLNDQFPACWELERQRRGLTAPAPQDYGGPHPLSEPEAAALAELTRAERFSRVLSLHTQGKEIYWNYRDREPREAEAMAARLAAASGGRDSGAGYRAVKLSGSDAGYKDWFIDEFRRPGFTVEAGEGVNPLPVGQFDEIYEGLAPILAEFIWG
ncbi:g-D-glutamyl-meso-diaminopimelate peptidase [Fontibacillus phaseoli]|uniref:G-D-glutamyl-meso-diaminopimelate peptidase n=1 Tax=Fontibacillus phaseoli TaxID=1416533 RepID=A0A369BQA4_9BACL|nr:g-D-glutamyl-meso-diaminopimelate peptidase [Fontibacillus phaseoli]